MAGNLDGQGRRQPTITDPGSRPPDTTKVASWETTVLFLQRLKLLQVLLIDETIQSNQLTSRHTQREGQGVRRYVDPLEKRFFDRLQSLSQTAIAALQIQSSNKVEKSFRRRVMPTTICTGSVLETLHDPVLGFSDPGVTTPARSIEEPEDVGTYFGRSPRPVVAKVGLHDPVRAWS